MKNEFQFKDSEFKKSSLSHGGKKVCVQVAINDSGVGVRDSKDATKQTIRFTIEEWKAFIGGVKLGEFDIA